MAIHGEKNSTIGNNLNNYSKINTVTLKGVHK